MKYWSIIALLFIAGCKSNDDPEPEPEPEPEPTEFVLGADLSYLNQIVDHGGVYKDAGADKNPYQIFADHGTDLVRLRLWHNPVWTKEVYDGAGTQLYNDLKDVEKSIAMAKERNMKVLLDFHFSDTWADPGKQYVPAAWKEIKNILVLRDSVYNYTFKTLTYLKNKNLMPEFVQLGNETNCGMLYSDAPAGFPSCYVCGDQWSSFGQVLNEAIAAVRDVSEDTKVVLHVADPKNVQWWFDNLKTQAGVTDFDIIGFSYYPLWHTTVSVDQLSTQISSFKTRYAKEVIILETAYPWTTNNDDGYTNLMGGTESISGYPYTVQGQVDLLTKIRQEVKDGNGMGVVYWEPGWITSDMKDLWGTGSSWENCAFFDFDGNALESIDFLEDE
jgi:arabinogalactan endo-1,4-beta-galactosidase